MINRPNSQPKIISQQMMPAPQQRPPVMQPRPPIAQPGMAQSINVMMGKLILGIVVFLACIVALLMIATNFKTFTSGSGAFLQLVFRFGPYILGAIIVGWLLRIFKKEFLQLVEYVYSKVVYTKPARDMAVAKVKQVEAMTENKKLEALAAYELMQAQAAQKRALALQTSRVIPTNDQNSAIGVDLLTGQYVPIAMPMREFPAQLHSLTYHNAPKITGITEESQKQLEAPEENEAKDIHVPTFGESMNAGLVGPGQGEILVCHALERDDSGALTGAMIPIKKPLGKTSTLLEGGSSGSGKTTLMLHLALQGAMMNALYYVIDPHMEDKDESIAARLS
ncbi:MAG TPA: hypothetical protein VH593_28795, partial [Ktedonobacteraceae bacterium]